MTTNQTDTNAQTTAPTPTPTTNPISELAQAIVAAMKDSNSELANAIIQAQQASAAPRQKTLDEVLKAPEQVAIIKRTRRLMNEGRRFFQNNYPLTSGAVLSDAEVDLLHQLKPGVWVNGLVTITETMPNGVGGDRHVHITHKGATPDQRIALKNECRNFEELLRRCVADAEADRKAIAS